MSAYEWGLWELVALGGVAGFCLGIGLAIVVGLVSAIRQRRRSVAWVRAHQGDLPAKVFDRSVWGGEE